MRNSTSGSGLYQLFRALPAVPISIADEQLYVWSCTCHLIAQLHTGGRVSGALVFDILDARVELRDRMRYRFQFVFRFVCVCVSQLLNYKGGGIWCFGF
jgi:hypothetical protein